ncbi:hypothetical protein FJU30_13550 [Affinibrenneria salicis]|uniref:Uncharacterized protein n=1 Tax=Affinibrenneria salicis TaxID=2590031 RepID=A0A5J5FZ29_9GAMM|nr:hypothetical protein [Affinibrenneria salicis]KAA8999359.1 hypothetical protein FJU30_13550 [Affinibrenneria salicis]
MENYIFLIKHETIVPIALTEQECGTLIIRLIEQAFYLSPVSVRAVSSHLALNKFQDVFRRMGRLRCNDIKRGRQC